MDPVRVETSGWVLHWINSSSRFPAPSRTEEMLSPFCSRRIRARSVVLLAGGRDANRWKAMAPSEKTSEASETLRTSEMASGDM
jgi:hypothetical protein